MTYDEAKCTDRDRDKDHEPSELANPKTKTDRNHKPKTISKRGS